MRLALLSPFVFLWALGVAYWLLRGMEFLMFLLEKAMEYLL